jgi:hypothetical protein
MIVFKILLIILVAAPVIGISLFFYSQMMTFIRERNKREKAEIERERLEKRARRKSASEDRKAEKAGRKTVKGRKSGSARKRKAERNEEQE